MRCDRRVALGNVQQARRRWEPFHWRLPFGLPRLFKRWTKAFSDAQRVPFTVYILHRWSSDSARRNEFSWKKKKRKWCEAQHPKEKQLFFLFFLRGLRQLMLKSRWEWQPRGSYMALWEPWSTAPAHTGMHGWTAKHTQTQCQRQSHYHLPHPSACWWFFLFLNPL